MAKQGIDPAFQAAPYLGDSSHDPIEFTRRQNTIKYQRNKQRQDELQKGISKGLDKLTLDLKDLYGEKGIDEVLGDQARAKDVFMKLQKSGINVFNPTSALDIKALQAITKVQEETMKKVDVITANKSILDSYSKVLLEDGKLPKEKQMFDHEATLAKIKEAKEAKGGVLDTQGIFDNILVKNPTPGDLDKYVSQYKDFIPKVNVDPVTGEENREQLKAQRDYMERIYETLPENEVRALTDLQKRVPAYKVAPLKDIFMDLYSPAAAGKLTKPSQSKGTGLTFNILGSNAKIVPGERQDNELKLGERTYGERYQLDSKPIYKVPTGGGMMQDEDMKWNPIEVPGYAEANLMFYDPKSDELVFRTTSSSQTPGIEANITFSVPRKNVKDAESYPIKLLNGKTGTLKDILPKDSAVTKKKAYNPKTGKFE
jgi:hypothetical protein